MKGKNAIRQASKLIRPKEPTGGGCQYRGRQWSDSWKAMVWFMEGRDLIRERSDPHNRCMENFVLPRMSVRYVCDVHS